MAALTLLIVSACATTPAKVVPLPPPGAAALPPTLQATPLPLAVSGELLPAPPLAPAETAPASAPATAEPFVVVAVPETAPIVTAAQPKSFQSFASYYAKRFEGRRTASGERYDPTRMTAATRDFPLQSWLKVINPANGREVIVRINDRTGKRKTPLIDLSRAAAEELGFLGKGKIRVLVIPVLPPTL